MMLIRFSLAGNKRNVAGSGLRDQTLWSSKHSHLSQVFSDLVNVCTITNRKNKSLNL